MSRRRWGTGIRLVLIGLGVFGGALAITGLLLGLPRPAAGGTCGPGRGSETAAEAFFDPVTIGAGPEPATTHATARAQWSAFVQECQSAADDRARVALPLLAVSAGLILLGVLGGRRGRPGRTTTAGGAAGSPAWVVPANAPLATHGSPPPFGAPVPPSAPAPGGFPAGGAAAIPWSPSGSAPAPSGGAPPAPGPWSAPGP